MDFLHIVWDPASDGLKLFGNFKNSLLQFNVDGSIYSWLSNNEKSIF